MTRKQLEDLGLEKEQADLVIRINGDDIENAKKSASTEISNLKAENEALSKQVGDRDKQIEDLKKSAGDNEDLKKQISDLQKTNKEQADAHEKEMHQMRVDTAVEKALAASGAKNIKAVKALLELAGAEFDSDGTVKGLAGQIEKLKGDDSSKFLFKENVQEQQSFTGFQPGMSTTVPGSKQAGYETRLAEARKNNNQLEVIKIKQEAFADGGMVLM